MSILIDNFISNKKGINLTQNNVDKKWYLAKPIPFLNYKTLYFRFIDAFRVIKGKSFAVHYKEDD